MADKPCNQCQNYDPILKGKGRVARHGRCAVRSTYLAVDPKGQTAPPGVTRAAPGELAAPYIVKGSEVNAPCTLFRIKPTPPAARPSKTPPPAVSTRKGGRR